MSKTTSKRISRTAGRWFFFIILQLFRYLPLSLIVLMTDGLLAVAFWPLKRLRAHAQESLTIAFGNEKSAEEINSILRNCFMNLGRGIVEVFCYIYRPWLISQKIHLTRGSQQHLDNALRENKGVVGISAHFGNFPLMLIYLSQLGYPVHALIRPNRDAGMEKIFKELQVRMKFRAIDSYPRKECVRSSFKALRNKEAVVILMDQNTGSSSGVFVNFFGRPAETPTGAVTFAMRTGSPILPIFTVRDGKGTHKVIIEPHFYLEQKATDEETLQYNVQKITAIIETYIRQYPTEWAWMHRRWKTQKRTAAL